MRAVGLHVELGGVEIIRGVDLQVEIGSVVGVLGPSGAGKTTLFRALMGELRARSGRVFLRDEEVTKYPLWRRARAGMGYVPQTPSVLFDLTVRRNIRTFEAAARVVREPAERRAELVGLEQRMDVTAGELSGGERRRLELLRAVIAKPNVLICDEPLTGVDPAGAGQIGRLLRSQAARGASVILADHRIREALPFCDEALLLIDGRIEVVAPPDAFAEHSAVRERYLG